MINSNKTIINNSNIRNLILTEDELPDITTLSSNITTEGNTNRSLCANNTFKYNTNASTSAPLNSSSISINVYAGPSGSTIKNPNWVTLDTTTSSHDGNMGTNVYDTSAKYATLTIGFKCDDPPVQINRDQIEIDWGPNLDSHHYKVLWQVYGISGTTISSQIFEWWRGATTMYLTVNHSSNYDYSFWLQVRFIYLD